MIRIRLISVLLFVISLPVTVVAENPVLDEMAKELDVIFEKIASGAVGG